MKGAQSTGSQGTEINPVWSIGIYAGASLSDLVPHPKAITPALSAQHVTDMPARFVADPFLVRKDGAWLMFMEVMNAETRRGEIALARSADGVAWTYVSVVLREPFHLSYPYVFEAGGRFYMIPETLEPACIRLYAADPFPTRWSHVADLVQGRYADSSIFHFGGRWWIFACARPYRHDVLNLFSAPALDRGWEEHPMSPVMKDNNRAARPAGRVLAGKGGPIRFAQDCSPRYGTAVRAFHVTNLTTTSYAEAEFDTGPILGPGPESWNRLGMHHIDAHRMEDGSWLAAVDGIGPLDAPDRI
jgi:hypothetical protein